MRSAARLPVGTVVDATRGRLRLVSALDGAGRVQTARLWGGRFQVRQNRAQRGMTSLALRGGSFRACPRSRAATISRVPRENGTTRRVVRSLWVRDRNGRFRTHGNNSVATARGTAWVTEDRCDGTVTRVIEGSMAVRARGARRTVVVHAGRSHLTPKR